MERKDLVPDPQYRRAFNPQAVGLGPAPQRMAQAARQTELMGLTCPKCQTLFRHPVKAGLAFCKADDPPWFGPGRGCGWILAIFPPHRGGTRGRAEALMDCNRHFRPDRVNPDTGKPEPGFKLPEDVYNRVVLYLWERWESIGLGKIHKREDGRSSSIRSR